MKYPYLVASLPVLSMDEQPAFTPEDFVRQCRGVLSDEDQAELVRVLAGRREGCRSGFAADWFAFEDDLRHRVAEVRAGRLGLDHRSAVPYHPAQIATVQSLVVDAFSKSNPLEREWALDNARWYHLELLAGREPFDLGEVLAYACRLVLARRWTDMTEDGGNRAVDGHLEAILAATPAEAL